jgi:hypothetical protein
MKALPDDLAVMGTAELSEQRALLDDELAPLFQRWPALDRFELRRLRMLYRERLRIARYVGRLRGRSKRKPSRPTESDMLVLATDNEGTQVAPGSISS